MAFAPPLLTLPHPYHRSLSKDIEAKAFCWFSITHHCVSHDGELRGWIWGQTGGAPLLPPSSVL